MDVTKGTIRGKLFVDFLKTYIKDPVEGIVLDVGCSTGALTFNLASQFKKVIGIDVNKKDLEISKNKAKKTENVEIKELSILNTEFKDNFFDLVIFEGVLEWVGYGDPKKTPKECQIQALKETKRILKKDGLIYVGIENRLFPYFWLSDPHVHTPLTVIMPRRISQKIYKIFKKHYYGLNLLSYWGYLKLVNNIFGKCQILLPLPNYRYIFDISPFNGKIIRNKIKDLISHKNLGKTHKLKLYALYTLSYFSLLKVFAPTFIIISKK